MALRITLCATDLSPGSATALKAADTEVRSHGGQLVVLFVMPDPAGAHPHMPVGSYADVPALQKQALDALTAYVAEVLGDAGSNTDLRVEFGVAYTVIADQAKALDAQLLVVGARGRSGLERMLLGSVADQVARSAPCSVLIVR